MNENKLDLPAIQDGEDKSSILGNRIRKNYRHVKKWAKRSATNCFRIYDHEIGRYPLAIDFYAGRFSIQFFSRDRENPEPSQELVDETTHVLQMIFGIGSEKMYWRSRIKREKTQQYEKLSASKEFFTVLEYGVQFKINLQDYLDTGLFLDHRETRMYVAKLSEGKKLLNLFAYTCSFSVHAAAAGATYTKSVDMSNTYTDWGRDNFDLNSLSSTQNEIVRADCLKFLDEEILSGIKYDVIVIDPPTISRSKKMEQMFDIQEDYQLLISKALQLLEPFGIIVFSTNSRKFRFDEEAFKECKITNITDKTIPIDFHNQKIHRCWKLQALR